MGKYVNLSLYVVITYLALYACIWLHELGHAAVFFFYDCKATLFNLNVPYHFAGASPDPLLPEKVKLLQPYQLSLAALGGILFNFLFAFPTVWMCGRYNLNPILKWFLLVFALSHLTEAFGYLTLCNLYPLGDVYEVSISTPLLRFPLFFIGMLVGYATYKTIRQTEIQLQRRLWIYCCTMLGVTVLMRFLFA